MPSAKAHDQNRPFSRSAEALLPLMNEGAPTKNLHRIFPQPLNLVLRRDSASCQSVLGLLALAKSPRRAHYINESIARSRRSRTRPCPAPVQTSKTLSCASAA